LFSYFVFEQIVTSQDMLLLHYETEVFGAGLRLVSWSQHEDVRSLIISLSFLSFARYVASGQLGKNGDSGRSLV
jgi:hypothetical protein